MKKLCGKHYRFIAGAVLLILLFMNLFYWGSQKEGFFCDELYSYHFTNQVKYPYIIEEYGEKTWMRDWHPSEFFQDYLTLTEEERFDLPGVWRVAGTDVHPPLYYLFLEMSSSVFATIFPGIFTKWSGILVNMVFFLLTMFFLWKLARELTGSDFWSALVCALYGFSAGAVSMVVFIRMYVQFTCFAVLFTWLNTLFWKALWKNGEKENRWLYPILAIASMAGALTQYYFLIYAFMICIVIWGYALLKQKYSFVVKYACSMAASLVGSYLIWPDILEDILSGLRGEEALVNLKDETRGILENFSELWNIMNGELFGKGIYLLLAFAAALLFCRVLSIWWRPEKDIAEDGSIHIRFQRRNPQKKLEFRLVLQDVILVQIFIAVMVYLVCLAKIAPYLEDRYISCVFPMIVLLVAALLRKLVSGMPEDIAKTAAAALIACTLASYLLPGVNYLYPGTEKKLETAGMYSDLPAFYITYGTSYRACGDSVYFALAKCTYPLYGNELRSIPEALARLDEGEITRCLFYVDLLYEDRDPIVQEIDSLFPKSGIRWLFDTEHSAVYIVE
ncbi:MAG: glycosyltransferase family 39 protein [Blautia sp.]|nr:glycosyltransferase family 39 protein [Blautia sp.]MCM1200536.1 glycosyltransferase family 39 protein [Bacteroides fragilis]